MSADATDSEIRFPAIDRKLIISVSALVLLWIVSMHPALSALNESLLEYLRVVWWAVLLGVVVGGVIDYFVPDGFIARLLGQRRAASLLNAILAGFLMSACSHGILAISMQLYKKGASVPSVIAFLLASPWANFPMTVLLFGFFGWRALWIIGGAMAVALLTGYAFAGLDRLGLIEPSLREASSDTVVWNRIQHFNAQQSLRGVAAGGLSLANMVVWWIVIGIIAAALIGAYVPAHWFMSYLGPDALGMSLTLLGATILEVCSEGTSPVALEIYDQTGVLGNPFVFLMAGVATDYTEIGLIWSNVGRRAALWLPLIAVPQILVLGFLFNLV